jgi:hypothetical protein
VGHRSEDCARGAREALDGLLRDVGPREQPAGAEELLVLGEVVDRRVLGLEPFDDRSRGRADDGLDVLLGRLAAVRRVLGSRPPLAHLVRPYTLLRAALKAERRPVDAPRVDAQPDLNVRESLAELELLVFGTTLEDESLVQRFLAADASFTAHVIARLAREPIVLH